MGKVSGGRVHCYPRSNGPASRVALRRLAPEVLADLAAQPTELGDALAALGAAVAAWGRGYTGHAEAWTLIGAFRRGRLMTPI